MFPLRICGKYEIANSLQIPITLVFAASIKF